MNINALIARAARQAGVPERLFASLILHGERSWQGWQTSPAGAFGPAQLMPGTAAGLASKYGINPHDYYGNLLGGAYYLKEQLQAFGGNPRKAVAAYNAGPGTVRSGSLPAETQRYLKNVLGNLGGERVAQPVAAPSALAPAPVPTAPGPVISTTSLKLPAPPDLTGLLTENLGKIAQGWSPTEVMGATTPTLLESWMRPSQLTITKTRSRVPVAALSALPPSVGPPTGLDTHRPAQGFVPPVRGKIIGTPYSGTHTLGNWESDNAIDIAVPVGTPIRAVSDGVIGTQFGSLDSGNPRMAGLRLHLISRGNEYYYAHLSKFANGVKPGTHVRKGQIIGYSGEANGVAHLHFAEHSGNPAKTYGRR